MRGTSTNPGKVEKLLTLAVIPTLVIVKLPHERAIPLMVKELCLHLLGCSDHSVRESLVEGRKSVTAKAVFRKLICNRNGRVCREHLAFWASDMWVP